MKQKETSLNTQVEVDEIGDDHVGTSYDTPLRPDAFEQDDDLKVELISKHFKEIMQILGLDLEDD
ncbi:MAG: GTP cyclohydrolase I FolE, partial [Ekhidna sp.]